MKINFKKILILFFLIFFLFNTLNINYSFSQEDPNEIRPLKGEGDDYLSSPTSSQEEPLPPKKPTSTLDLTKDPDMREALTGCEKAVKLAQMYGFLVTYSPNFKEIIKKLGLDKEVKEQNEKILIDIANNLGIDTNKLKNNLNSFINEIKNETGITKIEEKFNEFQQQFVQKFTNFFTNSEFTQNVKKQVDNIIKDAAKSFISESSEYVTNLVSDIGKGITGFLDTSVPTNDKKTQEAIKKSTEAIVESNAQIINELKRQQAIQSTREKCLRLLKETVSQIKNSLLFQLSSQIIEAALNDESIIKDREKLKEMAWNTVANNFLSNVAPQLCSNFKIETDLGVSINVPGFYMGPHPAPPFEWKCTLEEVEGRIESIKDFFKNFENGGWKTFWQLLKPQNDWIWTSLYLNYEISRQYNEELENLNFMTKDGFMAKRRCTFWKYYQYKGLYDPTIKITNGLKWRGLYYFQETETIFNADTFETYLKQKEKEGRIKPDTSGPPVIKGYIYFVYNENQSTPAGMWECISTEITQPASIVENLTQKAAIQELEILKEADDLEQYFYYIRNSIIQKLIKKGYNGLRELLPKEINEFTNQFIQ